MHSGSEQALGSALTVGFVTTSFPVVGQPESGIFVERLVASLSCSVFVIVLTPGADADPLPRIGAQYQVEPFAYGPKAWMRLAHRPGGIPDAMRRRDPALVLLPLLLPAMFIGCLRLAGRVDVMHGNWSVAGVVAAIAARLRGRPSVVTFRGDDVTRAERSRLFRWVLRFCITWNYRTIVVSESMGETLRRWFPRQRAKISFIPNGVSLVEEAVRPRFHSPLRLLVVASLIRRKRLDTLIAGVADLTQDTPVILRIVGDGALREELAAQARRSGVDDCVEFVGSTPPEMVQKQMVWADIFVFASESEGRPNVVLEAMASGLPIVATAIPGVQELLGDDAGLLFPVGDAEAFARQVRVLVSHPEKAFAMGDRGKASIKNSDLTWDAAGRRYAEVYLSALKENSTS